MSKLTPDLKTVFRLGPYEMQATLDSARDYKHVWLRRDGEGTLLHFDVDIVALTQDQQENIRRNRTALFRDQPVPTHYRDGAAAFTKVVDWLVANGDDQVVEIRSLKRTANPDGQDLFFLVKNGGFYRAKAQGYTVGLLDAGLFSRRRAYQEVLGTMFEVKAIPACDMVERFDHEIRSNRTAAEQLAVRKLQMLGQLPVVVNPMLGYVEAPTTESMLALPEVQQMLQDDEKSDLDKAMTVISSLIAALDGRKVRAWVDDAFADVDAIRELPFYKAHVEDVVQAHTAKVVENALALLQQSVLAPGS